MHVYIAGAGEDGPVKIGIANDPMKRLRALQTGSAASLSLLHVERVGPVAPTVERLVHRLLSDRRETGEWFDTLLIEAQAIVRGSCAATEIFTNESSSLSTMTRSFSERWLTECSRLDTEREDRDQYSDWDMHEREPPDIVLTFAETCPHPPTARFRFSDYLEMFDAGAWFGRAAQLGRRVRDRRRLGSYLDIERRFKLRGPNTDLKLPERWIEWSLARDLTLDEVGALTGIWNTFALRYNAIEHDGPQRPTRGIDDHVDGVRVFVLMRDEEHGLPNCIAFACDAFLAILRPDERLAGFAYDLAESFDLRQISEVQVSGFVTTQLDREQPFLHWFRSAPERRDSALLDFIHRPIKGFPSPRPYSHDQEWAIVRSQLLRLDEVPLP